MKMRSNDGVFEVAVVCLNTRWMYRVKQHGFLVGRGYYTDLAEFAALVPLGDLYEVAE